MKKYISIVMGISLAMGMLSTASAQAVCDKLTRLCTDGGDGSGGHAQSCINTSGRTITWEFTDFEGPYERCTWGPPPRFSDKPDGSFALLGGCQNVACGGLKKAPSFSSAVAARGSSSAVNPSTAPSSRAAASTPTPSRPLTSSELLVRSRVQAIMGSFMTPPAPSAPAGSSAPTVFNRPATSFSPDLSDYAGIMTSGVTSRHAPPAAAPFRLTQVPALSSFAPADMNQFFMGFLDNGVIEGSNFLLGMFNTMPASFDDLKCSYIYYAFTPNFTEKILASAPVSLVSGNFMSRERAQLITPPPAHSSQVYLKCVLKDNDSATLNKEYIITIPRIVKDPDVNATLSIVSSGYPNDPSGSWGESPVNDGGLIGLVSGSAQSVSNIIRITAGTEVRNITQRPSLNVGIQEMRVFLGSGRDCRRSVPVSATNQAGRTTTVTASVTLTTAQCNALNPCNGPRTQVICEDTKDLPYNGFCAWNTSRNACYSTNPPRPGPGL